MTQLTDLLFLNIISEAKLPIAASNLHCIDSREFF